MRILTEEQLNNLNKEALVIIVASLQDQLGSMHEQLNTANARLADTNRQIELLTEQIRIMNQRQFGRHSESGLLEGQLTLFDSFNEAEAISDSNVPEPEISEVIIASYRRKKSVGKRDADLDGLPARIIEHRLSEEELSQLFPNGYKELPNEVYRRLHIIPETFIVDEHHVHVYASKDNDGTIVKAPRSVDLFRNSIATPSLVASIINGKYGNALPLDRQSRAFKCNGINLATNTMANWVIKSADNYLSLLYDRLHELIYDNHIIHADESPLNPNPKYAPYRQMEKLELYRKIAMQLVEKGYAYECYCSEDELEIDRELQKQRGIVAPKYNRRCLHATPEQIAKWKEEGRKPCIRLKLQDHHTIKFQDLVRGWVEFNNDVVGCFQRS